MNNEELYHHGVLGMKWGVRKSRPTSGRSRKRKNNTKGWSKDAKTANAIKKKSVKQMSNKELKTLNNRMELESNYRRLNPSKVKKGLAIAGAVAGALGTVNNLYANGDKIIKAGQKVVSKMAKK